MEMEKRPDRVPPIAWLSCIAGIAGAVCVVLALLTVTLFPAAPAVEIVMPCAIIGVSVLSPAALIFGVIGLSKSSRRETFSRKGRRLSKIGLILGGAALAVWLIYVFFVQSSPKFN